MPLRKVTCEKEESGTRQEKGGKEKVRKKDVLRLNLINILNKYEPHSYTNSQPYL